MLTNNNTNATISNNTLTSSNINCTVPLTITITNSTLSQTETTTTTVLGNYDETLCKGHEETNATGNGAVHTDVFESRKKVTKKF